jgi:hypothetical protein
MFNSWHAMCLYIRQKRETQTTPKGRNEQEMKLTHKKTGDTIENLREWIGGYKADWHHDGKVEEVDGTFALGAALSFVAHTHTTPNGFRAGRYICIEGTWQY